MYFSQNAASVASANASRTPAMGSATLMRATPASAGAGVRDGDGMAGASSPLDVEARTAVGAGVKVSVEVGDGVTVGADVDVGVSVGGIEVAVGRFRLPAEPPPRVGVGQGLE